MHDPSILARRSFLGRASLGMGATCLAQFMHSDLFAANKKIASGGVLSELHFPVKAKRVIFLCMAGGPSHLETLDYKPKLKQMHGKAMPTSYTKGQPIAQLQGQKLRC